QWNITVQVLVESVSKWPWNECPSQRGLGVQVRMESPFPAVRTFKRPAVQVAQRIGAEFADGEGFAALAANELVVFVHKDSPI
ncbi:hypothetical protein, partial [Pseudomonas aeruginosa]|uniref:hypothetical protein n=1 Tax=Pseudomonas aeruginosa TaxID=287 RepID=UPI00398340E2